MTDDRTISRETIAEIVERIEPTWEVRGTTPAANGHHIVYHLDVETEVGRRQCVLKATPPEKPPTCDDEARLLAVLDAHTSLPVPSVIGVVDEQEALPAPCFLSSSLTGANYDRTDLTELSEPTVERLARSTGRHLARLHGLDAVDAFGFVDVDADEVLDGGRPSSRVEQLAVEDATDSWCDYLAAETERVVAGLDATRFGDLRSTVRPVLDAHVEDISGELDPVVARIDQSLDNALLDSETGAVTGLLDWEFCVAATPAYDLVFVEHSLAGGHWTLVPGVPDRRAAIRSAMLDGYREVGSAHVDEQFRENYDCYALLANLHAMLNFDWWFDQVGVPDERREVAVDPLRERVESFC